MSNRQIVTVDLQPAAGSRFQPTGFPDIGAALFDKPVRRNGELTWSRALLVESAQSMANHLEAVGWDTGAQEPVITLAGLPYVKVIGGDGRYLTSSRTEAHRLASAFVKDAALDGTNMRGVIRERLGLADDTPLAPRDIARAVMALDPLCLIHGVFFAESAKVWPGQPKIARAVTGCIEATDVAPVTSGGVKRDDVRHSVSEGGGATEGYGFVPFHRVEYTAGSITAFFSLDLAQLRSYGLGDDAVDLLAAVARWEVRSLLDGGMRLRTACDLVPVDPDEVDAQLPSLADLEKEVRLGVERCAALLVGGGPLEVVWSPKKTKAPPLPPEVDG